MSEEELRRLSENLLLVKKSIDDFIMSTAILRNDRVIWNSFSLVFKNSLNALTRQVNEFNNIDWVEIQQICSALTPKGNKP